MSIELRGITKRFGDFVAVDGVDLHVGTGELVALLGPSGSGKTSLLRIIAGLERADAGSVRIHGTDATTTHARDRGVGFVFQHYALFSHLTVAANIAFGLRVKTRSQRPSDAAIRAKVKSLLELVRLEGLDKRFPHELSGGQRQRIALARALAVEPRVLLLDEPFGALDARVRAQMRRWLREVHAAVHVTSVFVTHDHEEALELADLVAILDRGRIVQQGTPRQLYDRPATPFVFEFMGNGNRLASPDGAGHLYARPHEISVHATPRNGAFAARFVRGSAFGPVARAEFAPASGSEVLNVEMAHDHFRALDLRPGSIAYLHPDHPLHFESAI